MKKDFKILLILLVFLMISFYLDKLIVDLMNIIRISFLNKIFVFIDKYFSYYLLALIITLLPLLKNKDKLRTLLKLWVSFLSAGILVYILKVLIARPRPLLSLIDVSNHSFPSGHAAIMFALVPVFFHSFKRYYYIWLLLSVLIAFSRIYLGAHYLSDVIGGIILGLIIGKNIINLLKFNFK